MKIAQLFGKGKTVFSCEVFPPKKTSPVDSIYKTLDGLKDIHPDFISVTFGAGGSSNVNQSTAEIASIIQNQYHITAMAHLTCVGCTKGEATEILAQLKNSGVENVLALRGDRNPDFPPKEDFLHADELVSFIHRKQKVDAGAQHLVSQLFFDNDDFYRFLERCRIAGIEVPIEAGIMPVLNKSSIERMVSLCGASMPRKLTRILARYGDHPAALREAGMAYAIDEQPRRGQADQREHFLHPERLILRGRRPTGVPYTGIRVGRGLAPAVPSCRGGYHPPVTYNPDGPPAHSPMKQVTSCPFLLQPSIPTRCCATWARPRTRRGRTCGRWWSSAPER